jgi:hypothetical protein
VVKAAIEVSPVASEKGLMSVANTSVNVGDDNTLSARHSPGLRGVDLLNTPGDGLALLLLLLWHGTLNGANEVGELLLTNLEDILTGLEEGGDRLWGIRDVERVGDPEGGDLDPLLAKSGEDAGLGFLSNGDKLVIDGLALLGTRKSGRVAQDTGGARTDGTDLDNQARK